MSQRIQVFVRKRPCLHRETNKPQIVEVIEEQSSVRLLDPDVFSNTNNVNKEAAVSLSSTGKTSQPRSHKETLFTFDGVFDEEVPTERIYSQVGQTHIDDVINGFNTTFFAYGATGAGKTYTMLGSSESTSSSSQSSSSLSQSISQQPFQSRGMMSLMVSGLFESIKSKQTTHDITVRLAYMEIYNEAIKDLLSLNTKGLQIREHTKSDTTIIHGLTEIEVNNDSQVSAILKVGSRNRSKDSTTLNDSSSRSHAILQLTVECLEKRSSSGIEQQHHQQNQQLVTSKLMMVDLAGSEKSWTNKSKASKLEGANINQSLLALGNCIQLLSQIHMSQTPVKDTFIPYRASKLTRILKDSLGGNCRTIMIANISGSILSYDDTYNTLKYASRAKNITVHVQQNITTQHNPPADYSVIIENLSRENENLRSMLQSNHNNGSFDGFNDNSLSFVVPSSHKRIQTSSGNSNHISQVNTSRNDVSDEEKKAVAEIEHNMNKHFEEEAMCLRIIAEANTKIERIKKSNIQLEMHSKLANNSSNNPFQPSFQQPQQGYLAYANQQSAEEAKQSLEEAQSKLKQLVQLRKGLLPFLVINGQPSIKGAGTSPLAAQLSQKSQQYLSNAFRMHEMKSNNLQLSSKISRESEDIDTLEKELNALSHQVELRESILNQQKTTIKPASMTSFQSIITSLPNITNSSASQHSLSAQEHQQLSKSSIQEQQQSGYLSSSANNVIVPKQQRLVQQSSAWKNYYSPPSYGSYMNNISLSQNSLPGSNGISSTKHQLKHPNFSKYTPSSHSRSRYVKYNPTQHFSSLKHSSHSRHASSSSSLLQVNNEEPSIVSSYLSYQYTGPDDSNKKKKKQKRKEYFQSSQIVESRISGNNGSTILNNNHSSVQGIINDNSNSNSHITQRLRNQSAIQYDNYSFEPTEKTNRNIVGIISNREGGEIDNTVTIPSKKQAVPAAKNSHSSASASSSGILTNWIISNPNSTPSTNRILPQIILSRNSRSTYDVHQSPYVRSFNSPSLSSRKNKQSMQLISPNTRKAQLQKLNWNINKFKQSYDGNAVGKQNIISYGVVA